MLTGTAGIPFTTNVRAEPDPQLLFATTETVTVLKFAGKLIEVALRLFGPEMEAPLFTLHV